MDKQSGANHFIDNTEACVAKVHEKTAGLKLRVLWRLQELFKWDLQGQCDAGVEFYTTIETVYDNY
jgi:hypothetical protein